MAYNGFPATYQPMYYPQYQPVQMPQTNNNSSQNAPIIWVQGEAGAKSYLIAPNTTVPLWDSETQRIFLKTADAAGMPTMKILSYTIEEPRTGSVPTFATENAKNVENCQISAFEGKISDLKHEIDAMRADLETFRGDLYGIAGKKPTVKKKEAASDD